MRERESTEGQFEWRVPDVESDPLMAQDSRQSESNRIEKKRKRSEATFLEKMRHSGIRNKVLAIMFAISPAAMMVGVPRRQWRQLEINQEFEPIQKEVDRLKDLLGDNPKILRENYMTDHVVFKTSEISAQTPTKSDIVKPAGERKRKNDYRARTVGSVEAVTTAERRPVNISELRAHLEDREIVLSEETIRKVLEVFPKTWVKGEVNKIRADHKSDTLPKSYGIRGSEAAATAITTPYGLTEITFHKASENHQALTVFLHILPHEIAHANDWDTDSDLDFKHRLDLLSAVTNRVQSSDRYQSSYVEAISNKDPQRELYIKTQEYWAEISRAYFSDPDNLSESDYSIVDNAIKDAESDYNSKGLGKRVADITNEAQHANE